MENHVCTPETCPDGDDYFVSAIDGHKNYYIAGPYNNHPLALSKVSEAFDICNKTDGRTWFMSWGTVKLPANSGKVGSLNKLGLIK